MSNDKWIRVRGGMAGRNGYILKGEGGYTAYLYGDAEPYATFEFARDAKKCLDAERHLDNKVEIAEEISAKVED